MNEIADDLFETAEQLDSLKARFEADSVKEPLQMLEDTARKLGKSWSGSWLGYHSRVYYEGFHAPPPGARFSQEWGLMDVAFGDTVGYWKEYDYDYVKKAVSDAANNPNLKEAKKVSEGARGLIDDKRAEILSLMGTALETRDDTFLSKLKQTVEDTSVPRTADFVKLFCPTGKVFTRDAVAAGQGPQTPPHIDILANVLALRAPEVACENLAKTAKQAAAHLVKRRRYSTRGAAGDKVFIGHGRSLIWKELKDFVQDRLQLPWMNSIECQ